MRCDGCWHKTGHSKDILNGLQCGASMSKVFKSSKDERYNWSVNMLLFQLDALYIVSVGCIVSDHH